MTDRKKVEKATIVYTLEGSKKKLNFVFKALGQPALEAAQTFYNSTHSKAAVKVNYIGKKAIGMVIDELTAEEKNTTTKGRILDAVFPALTAAQRSNYRKLYQLSKEVVGFTSWKEKNFPGLNSETQIIQYHRDNVKYKEVILSPDFIDWINADDKEGDTASNKSINLADFRAVTEARNYNRHITISQTQHSLIHEYKWL